MLKKTRIALALLIFLTIILIFLDFYGWLPVGFSFLADIQFIPALLAGNMIVFVSILILTFVFGRIYCSVICPLGILQDISTWIRKQIVKKKLRFKFKNAKNIYRYTFLSLYLFAFITGLHFLIGLLDPYSSFGRISVHLFKPIYLAGNNLLFDIWSDTALFYKASIYWLGLFSTLIALISLTVVLVMSWKTGRLYCNTVCPVGTFLGFISRFSILRIYFDESKCTSCAICSTSCKSECIDFKNQKVDMSRCVTCFDCLPVCRESGLKYGIRPGKSKIDQSRRTFMMMGGVAAVSGMKLFASSGPLKIVQKKVERKQAIMPPGALNLSHFSEKCTSCHLCVSKCPSQVIKPSLLEYGISGMMQPMLSFENGFCNYDCTDCADICPTGALVPMDKETKNQNQMGVVQLDLEKCIVVKDETNCGACSEHCPTQAVSMKAWKDALTIPFIDQRICVGCGGCEYICPAEPMKAIYVEGLEEQILIVIEKREKQEVVIDDFGF